MGKKKSSDGWWMRRVGKDGEKRLFVWMMDGRK